MFEEHGLGYYGAEAAASCKTGGGREEMDEKDHEIAHFRILTTERKLAEFRGKLAIRQGHAPGEALQAVARSQVSGEADRRGRPLSESSPAGDGNLRG